jgi:2-dehydro-3-deoxyphosphooctonate aldolase (KDO 8-P synthase)
MTAEVFELAPGVSIGGSKLPIVAGPCVIESSSQLLELADRITEFQRRLETPFVFKASFDKANRSSLDSYRGPGLQAGLELLAEVSAKTGLPTLTDVHEPNQCGPVADVCDCLQIPAFLCRQTDLILAAAATGKPVNLKKGQFMAPDDMRRAVDKARSTGNTHISVTERGFSFGYHNLVVDMRSFAIMQGDGIPVIFDVTHSLQLPGGDKQTGGARQFAEPLARAAVAAGADGLYIEIHQEPDKAFSDHTTQLDPVRAETLLESVLRVHQALQEKGAED